MSDNTLLALSTKHFTSEKPFEKPKVTKEQLVDALKQTADDFRQKYYSELKQHENNIALINLHAGHYVDTQKSIFNKINEFVKKELAYSLKKSITRVIMSGDYNRDVFEDNTSDYTIKFIEEFKLKRSADNKHTCCSVLGYGHKFNYDHVLDSKSVNHKKILGNLSKTYKYPASDHVLIIVSIKS